MATSTSSMRSTIGSSAGGFFARVIRGLWCWRAVHAGNGGAPGLCQTGRDAAMLPVPAVTAPRLAGVLGEFGRQPARASRTTSACPRHPAPSSCWSTASARRTSRPGPDTPASWPRGWPGATSSAPSSRRRPPPRSRASRRAGCRASTASSGYRVLDAGARPPREPAERLGRRHGARDLAARADASSRRPRDDGIRELRGRCGALRRLGLHARRAARRGVPAGRDHRRPLRRGARAARAASRARSSTSTFPNSTRPRTRTAGSPTGGSRSSSSSTPSSPAFERRMPRGTGLLVTADHGVVDVPRAPTRVRRRQARAPRRACGTSAGSRAACSLYFEPGLDAGGSRSRSSTGWRAAEEHRAWVVTRDEAIDAGLYGDGRRRGAAADRRRDRRRARGHRLLRPRESRTGRRSR